MEIAVVGSSDFTLGFQLAGINRLYNSNSVEESAEHLKELLNEKNIGIHIKYLEAKHAPSILPRTDV